MTIINSVKEKPAARLADDGRFGKFMNIILFLEYKRNASDSGILRRMLHSYDDYKSLTAPLKALGLNPTVCIMALSLIVLQYWHDELLYQRTLIIQGQWWRLYTGNWVHNNAWHLGLNLSGLFLVNLLSQPWLTQRLLAGLCIWLSVCVGLGLWWFSPQVQWYVGFSGLLYGLFLLCGLHLLKQRDWLGAGLILGGVCAKSLWDWWFTGQSISADLVQAPVIYAAHWYGMLGALAFALLNWLTNAKDLRVFRH